ncbi:MAG: valine--tRNA ligase [Chloroflexota bacterium]|nr:valine--tRNA ligase [Chloroflexota bacterium]
MSTEIQSTDFPSSYDHHPVEERLYQFWVDQGFFTPIVDWTKQPFVVIMPPPNVTGELHLGHALTAAIQDALVRWHRMRGDPTLWLPGTDHAGIATQVVVERRLSSENNVTRHELGREQFTERIWDWVDQYGNTIDQQLQRLGASCDWTRKRFTLDAGPSFAVRTTFVNLYRKGLIYQGERIINWCPRCSTALSDLEVKHQTEDGLMYYIDYLLEDNSGHLTIATTRPETMFADAAIAVHPDNSIHEDFLNKNAIIPLTTRSIPIIADGAVDLELGTGALKVTPGHDPTDFEIGQRHNLPLNTVITLDATLNDQAGPYSGMERYQARATIVQDLESKGFLRKIETHPMSIGHCDRCDTTVEPLVSKQWFMSIQPLAEPAIQAVKDGQITIVPERFTRVYLNWMENIRDWCISRQLWWGHRIPVWYCNDCTNLTVEIESPTQCSNCSSSNIHQDPDVLDTWFSSGLWTHSTLGWPHDTEDQRYFYPTSVMETGYDILFFWVARMVMLGIENTGQIPFHTVFIHGLVRDPYGAKMSKSRGNVIDPLQLVDQYGADALRFALTTGMTPGNDTRLSQQKMEAARNFANKLWNASRFVTMTLSGASNLNGWEHIGNPEHAEDRWLVSKFNSTIERVNLLNEQFMLGEAQTEIHEFIWGTFCDWYIEMTKVRLRMGDQSPLPVLANVLEASLRLLHPFMPFITEELWQRLMQVLPNPESTPGSLMVASYPTPNRDSTDPTAESQIQSVIELITGIRNIRAEFKVEPRRQLEAYIATTDEHWTIIANEVEVIQAMVGITALRRLQPNDNPPASQNTANLVVEKAIVYLALGSAIDVAVERLRLDNELLALENSFQQLDGRLNNPEFLAKAPEEVVEKERLRMEALAERKSRLRDLLHQLS